MESFKPCKWVKIKEGKKDEALAVVALVANLLARVSILLSPVMPLKCKKISQTLGFDINTQNYIKFIKNGDLLDDFVIEKIPPLFPRIEQELLEENKKEEGEEEGVALINIDDFFKTKLKVATILEAVAVEKSSKLLQLQVDLGEKEPRQIIAGIKEHYKPEELINTQICVVANLKPAKIMGLKSEGMLLAAKVGKKLTLIRPECEIENGANIG